MNPPDTIIHGRDRRAHEAATDGFDAKHIVGRGGFGVVYRGAWRGRDVAVKRNDVGSTPGDAEFAREVWFQSATLGIDDW